MAAPRRKPPRHATDVRQSGKAPGKSLPRGLVAVGNAAVNTAVIKRSADEVNKATTERPKKRMRSSFTQPIKVVAGIGDDQQTFFMYEDMICDKSTFFKAACSKDWRENQEKTVHLPEQEAEIIQMYLECVFGEEIDYAVLCNLPITGHDGYQVVRNEDESKFNLGFLGLCKLYVAADFLGDPRTQNEIIDWIVGFFASTANPRLNGDCLRFIANTSPPHAGLHRWMIKHLSVVLKPSDMECAVDSLPSASVVSLLKLFAAQRPGHVSVPQPYQSSQYHV